MSGYPAFFGALSLALPSRHRPHGTQQDHLTFEPYAATAKALRETEDRILRNLVYAPLAFPLTFPGLILGASIEVLGAAALDTALLPIDLHKARKPSLA